MRRLLCKPPPNATECSISRAPSSKKKTPSTKRRASLAYSPSGHHVHNQSEKANASLIIIRIRRMRRPLGTIQPLNMPQATPNLPLLLLRPRHLLLLPRAELHLLLRAAFRLTLRARARWRSLRTAHSRRDVGRRKSGAGERTTRPRRVVETIEVDGQMALLRQSAVGNVPLFGTQGGDELLAMGNHDDAAFVVADGGCEAAETVAVEEVGGFVEDEDVRVVPVASR